VRCIYPCSLSLLRVGRAGVIFTLLCFVLHAIVTLHQQVVLKRSALSEGLKVVKGIGEIVSGLIS
jgi:hypothetical protein